MDKRLAELAFEIEVVKEQLSVTDDPNKRKELLLKMRILVGNADERVRGYLAELPPEK